MGRVGPGFPAEEIASGYFRFAMRSTNQRMALFGQPARLARTPCDIFPQTRALSMIIARQDATDIDIACREKSGRFKRRDISDINGGRGEGGRE